MSSQVHADIPALHSFPTRRSSDLDSISPSAPRRRYANRVAAVRTARTAGISRRAGGPVGLRCTARRGGLVRFSPDRKSTRLNSSHGYISYAVFCLKKKNHLSLSRV